MAFEQKPNSGALFVNNRKESEKHPDWSGSALIEGREFWISGWTKTGAKGDFYSLSFKPKDAPKNFQPREKSFAPVASAAPQRARPTEKQMANQSDNPDLDESSVPF